ncbi:MAG: exopolysaccharide biosynthesis polyprenyl glycosylphosphotransferase [Candidatus Firestonebacteria bacterium]|nr:exopolysaccharide biosynthesis polyprenyl glycosylphosphotransferase [Candidatus Firestonebacteria bacterium]
MKLENKRRTIFVFFMVALDIFLISTAFIIAYRLKDTVSLFGIPSGVGSANYSSMYPVMIFSWLSILTTMRQYEPRRRWGIDEIFFSISIAVTLGIFFIFGFFYATHELFFSRLMVFYLWFFAIIFLSSSRIIIRSILRVLYKKGGQIVKKVLIAGWGEGARKLAWQYKFHHEMLHKVVGVVLEDDIEVTNDIKEKIASLSENGILGKISDICQIAVKEGVSLVILTGSALRKERLKEIFETLWKENIACKLVPNIYDLAPRYMNYDEISGIPMLGFRDSPMLGWEAIAKRAIDILGSIIGLIILSPLLIIVAILIKIDSPGPVFFTQKRIGQNGRPFYICKFRSMVKEAAGGPLYKVLKNDNRVTKIGAFIRKTSIDELPQLINVLFGDMSLVGPRPEATIFVEEYSEWNKRRLYLKPGLTGLAQANGIRGNTTIDEKTKYDLEYMENQSLLLDIKIILKTIATIFSHKEAY